MIQDDLYEEIRCCASCERVFHWRHRNCPDCGSTYFGAVNVYDSRSYVLWRLVRDFFLGGKKT